MIDRKIAKTLIERISQFPAVALLGPRQVGKTTLADLLKKQIPNSVYLDLELPSDRDKLREPELFLSSFENKLVILDEIQRIPELFQVLRGLIDQGRRKGLKSGRFLLLGSASIDLLNQSSESLAGRIAYLELAPFDVLEVDDLTKLWVRGGFPDSYLAPTEEDSFIWRENFIRTYLERDIPQLGPRIPSETLLRFWTMLAHTQGSLLNAAALAKSLSVDGKTIARYLDLMVDLFLVRRLQPYYVNTGKRLIKSPKVYVRDSGIVHALLDLPTFNKLSGNPIMGGSWEGFVIESLINVARPALKFNFYRTSAGAEIDLLITQPDGSLWAIEIKRSLTPKLSRGFYESTRDLKPARCFMVYAGTEKYPMGADIEVISVHEMARLIAAQ